MAFHGESAVLAHQDTEMDAAPGRGLKPLSETDPCSAVVVTGVLGGRRVARDLGDLGVRVGSTLTIVRRLTGGAVAVRRGGMTVAIGALLARQVMVRPNCA